MKIVAVTLPEVPPQGVPAFRAVTPASSVAIENSSAPISGVVPLRDSQSISVVTVAIGVPALLIEDDVE